MFNFILILRGVDEHRTAGDKAYCIDFILQPPDFDLQRPGNDKLHAFDS